MGFIKLLMIGAVFGIFLIGSLYFGYYMKDNVEKEQILEDNKEPMPKVPLYYDIDNPNKIYIYDTVTKEYVEVKIDE